MQLGGSIGAVDLLPNATGVRVAGATQGVRIGGPEPGQRNVVVESSGIISDSACVQTIKEKLGKKKPKFLPMNLDAYEKGKEAARRALPAR